jgi:hypothetical protein
MEIAGFRPGYRLHADLAINKAESRRLTSNDFINLRLSYHTPELFYVSDSLPLVEQYWRKFAMNRWHEDTIIFDLGNVIPSFLRDSTVLQRLEFANPRRELC